MRAVFIGLVLLWCPALAGSQCLTAESSRTKWNVFEDILYWSVPPEPPPTGFRMYLTFVRELPAYPWSVPMWTVIPTDAERYQMVVVPMYGEIEGPRGPPCEFTSTRPSR
jgi:hypothetical protein